MAQSLMQPSSNLKWFIELVRNGIETIRSYSGYESVVPYLQSLGNLFREILEQGTEDVLEVARNWRARSGLMGSSTNNRGTGHGSRGALPLHLDRPPASSYGDPVTPLSPNSTSRIPGEGESDQPTPLMSELMRIATTFTRIWSSMRGPFRSDSHGTSVTSVASPPGSPDPGSGFRVAPIPRVAMDPTTDARYMARKDSAQLTAITSSLQDFKVAEILREHTSLIKDLRFSPNGEYREYQRESASRVLSLNRNLLLVSCHLLMGGPH